MSELIKGFLTTIACLTFLFFFIVAQQSGILWLVLPGLLLLFLLGD
jgi:hypothetical protein